MEHSAVTFPNILSRISPVRFPPDNWKGERVFLHMLWQSDNRYISGEVLIIRAAGEQPRVTSLCCGEETGDVSSLFLQMRTCPSAEGRNREHAHTERTVAESYRAPWRRYFARSRLNNIELPMQRRGEYRC